MERKSILLCALIGLIFFFSACSRTAIVQNDREEMGLKGAVRSVTITGYEALYMDSAIVKDNLWYTRTITFDRSGRIREIIDADGKEIYTYSSRSLTIRRYDTDGELDTKEVTTYTPRGEILSWTQYDASDTILSQEQYRYDAQNRCIEKTIYSPMSFDLICRDYTYDEAGNRTAYTAYNPDLTPFYSWRCCYDSLGRKTSEDWLEPNGILSGRFTYEYNEKGYLLVEGIDDKYTNTYTYEYDEQGNWTRKYTTYAGGYDQPSFAIEEQTIVYF